MFYLFLLLHFLYATTLHGVRPLVSLFANDQGASALIIGLLVSAFAFIPMLIAIKVGRWLDKYGTKRMLVIGAILILLSLLIPIILPTILGLFVSQTMLGFSQISVVVSIQKTVGNMKGSRDKLISTLAFVASSGGLLGPLLSGFSYQHFGVKPAYIMFAFIVLVALLTIISIPQKVWESLSYLPSKREQTSSWTLLRNVNLRNALIISGLVLYSKELFTAYFPVYASNIGLSAGMIGILLSISAAASMIVRFFQFPLVNKFGRKKVLLTTLIISGCCYAFIPFFKVTIILAILVFLLGGGLGLGQPISLVYALNKSPKNRHGEALGLRITFNRAAQFSAPLFFGLIGSVAGVSPIFWLSGSFLFTGTYFTKVFELDRNEVDE